MQIFDQLHNTKMTLVLTCILCAVLFTNFTTEGEIYMTREEAIFKTVHNYGSVPDLAANSGISTNYLYRIANRGASACELSLSRAEKLIEVTGDYSIIKYLAYQFKLVLSRPPKAVPLGMSQLELVETLQLSGLHSSRAVRKFLQNPTTEHEQNALRSLYDSLTLFESIRYFITTTREPQWKPFSQS